MSLLGILGFGKKGQDTAPSLLRSYDDYTTAGGTLTEKAYDSLYKAISRLNRKDRKATTREWDHDMNDWQRKDTICDTLSSEDSPAFEGLEDTELLKAKMREANLLLGYTPEGEFSQSYETEITDPEVQGFVTKVKADISYAPGRPAAVDIRLYQPVATPDGSTHYAEVDSFTIQHIFDTVKDGEGAEKLRIQGQIKGIAATDEQLANRERLPPVAKVMNTAHYEPSFGVIYHKLETFIGQFIDGKGSYMDLLFDTAREIFCMRLTGPEVLKVMPGYNADLIYDATTNPDNKNISYVKREFIEPEASIILNPAYHNAILNLVHSEISNTFAVRFAQGINIGAVENYLEARLLMEQQSFHEDIGKDLQKLVQSIDQATGFLSESRRALETVLADAEVKKDLEEYCSGWVEGLDIDDEDDRVKLIANIRRLPALALAKERYAQAYREVMASLDRFSAAINPEVGAESLHNLMDEAAYEMLGLELSDDELWAAMPEPNSTLSDMFWQGMLKVNRELARKHRLPQAYVAKFKDDLLHPSNLHHALQGMGVRQMIALRDDLVNTALDTAESIKSATALVMKRNAYIKSACEDEEYAASVKDSFRDTFDPEDPAARQEQLKRLLTMLETRDWYRTAHAEVGNHIGMLTLTALDDPACHANVVMATAKTFLGVDLTVDEALDIMPNEYTRFLDPKTSYIHQAGRALAAKHGFGFSSHDKEGRDTSWSMTPLLLDPETLDDVLLGMTAEQMIGFSREYHGFAKVVDEKAKAAVTDLAKRNTKLIEAMSDFNVRKNLPELCKDWIKDTSDRAQVRQKTAQLLSLIYETKIPKDKSGRRGNVEFVSSSSDKGAGVPDNGN
ncbi:hypothetical protein KY362_05645 [Candidatus Woesearchaeota archaeon]|nr:hypothetical protein [Candidatus Woesearchaeota archaeon]